MNCDEENDSEYREGLSPNDRVRIVAEFWNEIHIDGDYGAADQVAVEEIEREVSEEISQRVPDVNRLESLTCKALHLIAGNIESTST